MFSPGAMPMTPANLSAKKTLGFFVKGDGKRHRVMLFARHLGFMPATRSFVAPAEWTEVVLPLAGFDGLDGRDSWASCGPDASPAVSPSASTTFGSGEREFQSAHLGRSANPERVAEGVAEARRRFGRCRCACGRSAA